MSNILEDIVAVKKQEIEKAKPIYDDDWLCKKLPELNRKCISLKENILSHNSTGIIAEFKRKSPSKGWFKPTDTKGTGIVNFYEKYGAAGASVLTDKLFFGGEIEDLNAVRKESKLPLLRKDFIIDEIQIQEAKIYGADVILLIAAILSPAETERLAAAAKKFGMEVLLEIHNINELDYICDDVDIIGVNNRNLETFETDINTSYSLAKKIPASKLTISESGISNTATIISLREAGFKGFLIGETFMKEADPGEAFRQFMCELKENS